MDTDACTLNIVLCLQDPFQIRGPRDGPHGPMFETGLHMGTRIK